MLEKENKKPQRMCVVCRQKFSKQLLNRYIIPKECDHHVVLGINMVLDINKSIEQRGYYLCNESNCLEKFQKLKLKNKGAKRLSNG